MNQEDKNDEEIISSMIRLGASKLKVLRMAKKTLLIKDEIKSIEIKIIKLFSNLPLKDFSRPDDNTDKYSLYSCLLETIGIPFEVQSVIKLTAPTIASFILLTPVDINKLFSNFPHAENTTTRTISVIHLLNSVHTEDNSLSKLSRWNNVSISEDNEIYESNLIGKIIRAPTVSVTVTAATAKKTNRNVVSPSLSNIYSACSQNSKEESNIDQPTNTYGTTTNTCAHDFVYSILPSVEPCCVCNKFILQGYRCRLCKIRTHKKCHVSFINDRKISDPSNARKDKRLSVLNLYSSNNPNMDFHVNDAEESFTSTKSENILHYNQSMKTYKKSWNRITNVVSVVNSLQKKLSTSDSKVKIESSISLINNNINSRKDIRKRSKGAWSRGSFMTEWTIPMSDIQLHEEIGKGRFGSTFRGTWHGDVAVKLLCKEILTDEQIIDFRCKVGTFRKTRHDNLVLFMGAVMEQPYFAIITNLIKGHNLFTHIYSLRTNFTDEQKLNIVQQLVRGIGYLHSRQILHKDLHLENIFLESNVVIITDFGLVNSFNQKIFLKIEKDLIIIPNRWVVYQPPEILKQLKITQIGKELDHYTSASDIYSIGIIWYELVANAPVYKDYTVEAVIWNVGSGIIPNLTNISLLPHLKDLMCCCWNSNKSLRPNCTTFINKLEKIPKHLRRSPSQPTKISSKLQS